MRVSIYCNILYNTFWSSFLLLRQRGLPRHPVDDKTTIFILISLISRCCTGKVRSQVKVAHTTLSIAYMIPVSLA